MKAISSHYNSTNQLSDYVMVIAICIGMIDKCQFSVSCNGHDIKGSKKVKYLALVIDNTVSGESVVQNIISKVNGKLKFLYRHNSCLDFNTRKILCSALLQCHFDYSCSSFNFNFNFILPKVNTDYIRQAQVLTLTN